VGKRKHMYSHVQSNPSVSASDYQEGSVICISNLAASGRYWEKYGCLGPEIETKRTRNQNESSNIETIDNRSREEKLRADRQKKKESIYQRQWVLTKELIETDPYCRREYKNMTNNKNVRARDLPQAAKAARQAARKKSDKKKDKHRKAAREGKPRY